MWMRRGPVTPVQRADHTKTSHMTEKHARLSSAAIPVAVTKPIRGHRDLNLRLQNTTQRWVTTFASSQGAARVPVQIKPEVTNALKPSVLKLIRI